MSNLFKFSSSKPLKFSGGKLWRASSKNFTPLRCLAIQALELEAGAIREPHVHPNAHQLDYCLAGTAKVGIIGPDGCSQYLTLNEGDISFVPQGYLHWIENIGKKSLRFLVVLSNEEPETIELSEMVSGVPGRKIQQLFGLPPDTFSAIPKGGLRLKGAF
jgi:oxalate decarboxylase/phosphoglucose isomerase-like protein (cupin superfamily)